MTIVDIPATVTHTLYAEVLTAEDIAEVHKKLLDSDKLTFNFTSPTGIQGNVTLGLTKAQFETELTKYIGQRINILVDRPKIKLLPVS